MKNIIIFPTWKCGLKCPYCQYSQLSDNLSVKYEGSGYTYKVKNELGPIQWLSLLLPYGNATYEFSGGEPLRYSGIKELFSNLPIWSITSNTLLYEDDMDLSHCGLWTASFHPHVSESTADKFILNIQKIAQKVPVAITLVARPQGLAKTFVWCNRFDSMGFRVNIHPYYDDPDFSWDIYYSKEKEILLKSKFLRYENRLFKFFGIEGNGKCRAGEDYFVFGPDGKKFRCLSDMLFGRNEEYSGKCSLKCYFPCDWREEKRRHNGS